MSTTTVDLMRHGEPVGGRRYRGQTDDPLSDRGWQQMWDAIGNHRGWSAVVTSPLQRCAAFADALGAELGVAVERDERLKEVGFGSWEGRTPADLEAEDPQQLIRFKADPLDCAPAGAEPLPEFCERVRAAWQDLLLRHEGRHVLLVAHAGVIRAVLAEVLALPMQNLYRMNISSAGLSRVRVETTADGRLPVVLFLNGKL